MGVEIQEGGKRVMVQAGRGYKSILEKWRGGGGAKGKGSFTEDRSAQLGGT